MPTSGVTVPALAAHTAHAALERSTIERRAARPHDVVIDIAYCGVCHSDIHQVRDEWFQGIFPMVPGHEIAGVVAATGDAVTRFAVGDRVGVGCFVDSCRTCESCLAGLEQYCLRGNVPTYNGRDQDGVSTLGGYSTVVVVDENYVLRIPEAIELAHAAPLLCAGITLYSPLRHWKAGPGSRVAVVGMGGLGHLGVQLAHALDAEVTVLSQSLSKQDDGRRLGADHYYATSDPATFERLSGSFDLILNTVSANLDVEAYLGLLRLDGALVHVGIPTAPDQVPMLALAARRLSIAASSIGGIAETQEMLDFCAEHGINPMIEVIGVDDVNLAYERVVHSDVRYRFVIDTGTF